MHRLLPLSLQRRRPARIRPLLDRIREVLGSLGDPQLSLPSILIVGTNGKGSTAAMLEAVLAAHGLRVGLYTSPHLVRVEERIRLAGSPIDAAALAGHLATLDRYPDLTFFEALTAAAFLAFSDSGLDGAVLEAGMGGRWDATRVAESEIAGLTNVGSDHARWLGERVEERAADKGAALMAARLRVLGDGVAPELLPHLGAGPFLTAAELIDLEPLARGRLLVGWGEGSTEVAVPFAGAHQTANLRLALALARCAADAGWIDRLRPDAVRDGLARADWPGRLSVHRVRERWVLLDCAHNLEGAAALAAYLAGRPILYHLLFSCLDDKPVEAMASILRPHVGNVVVFELEDERAMPIDRLRAAFPEAEVAPSVDAALRRLPDPVVAAGSLRVAGELLARTDQEVAA
ncbi:MAG: dihydrofolate synthase [Holophagae bacterium]|nr:MAG: dihydrofolate synthase [Holophagae bacterium]